MTRLAGDMNAGVLGCLWWLDSKVVVDIWRHVSSKFMYQAKVGFNYGPDLHRIANLHADK